MRSSKGKLTIDLQALRDNYALIQDKVGGACEVSAVVKADAYGLGADMIVPELMAQGCKTFFVANLEEAIALRQKFKAPRIAILNGFYDSSASIYAEYNLTPVLGSWIEIEGYAAQAQKEDRILPAFLHFNTGMNRLGLAKAEYDKLFENMEILDGLDIQLIMSHFACADEQGHDLTHTQYERFCLIADRFPNVPKSLANAPGIFADDKYHFDLVRPGMALYGLNPTPWADNPMAQLVSLELPVVRTRMVYEEAHVGYGATYRFEKDSWVATVSAGYADGIHRMISNTGAFYWKGYRLPVRGRVSMDLTSVDLSAVPENERPGPGDFLEVIGPNQTVAELGASMGSFDYEVLTSLGHRYERLYLNQSD